MVARISFLGASVSSFNMSIGWGSQSSNMEVILVEDRKNGDSFNPPDIGKKVTFVYGNNSFSGILQRWQKRGGSEGSPLYTATINDPRDLLSGTQMILRGYNDSVTIPNLLNVYGYLERDRFGASQMNSAGIPYEKIALAIDALTATSSIYGGPIVFEGEQYGVGLKNLPALPNGYRVSSDNLSVMDFIQEICDAAGRDFFFLLEDRVMQLYTVDRSKIPEIGKIAEFITNTDGAISKSIGIESRNGLSSKFVSGANVHDMYAQTLFSGEFNDFTDDRIWPYWGKYENGNVNIGYIRSLEEDELKTRGVFDSEKYKSLMMGRRHTIVLDAQNIDVDGVGDTYITDISELRAVASNVDDWKNFLDYTSAYEYIPEAPELGETEVDGKATIGRLPIGWETTYYTGDELFNSEHATKIDILPFDAARNRYVLRTPKLSDKKVIFIPTMASMEKMTSAYCMNKNTFAEFESIVTRCNALLKNKNQWGDPANEDLVEQYTHRGKINIHYLKAEKLGIATQYGKFMSSLLSLYSKNNNMKNLSKAQLVPINKFKALQNEYEVIKEEKIASLAQYLSDYARNYMGRQFMVSLPFILTDVDEETLEVSTTYSVADGGYIAEDAYDDAVKNNLLPLNTFNLELEDTRLQPYVRFDNADQLDLTELNPEEYTLHNNSLFLKCSAEQEFAYLDYTNKTSPRCVITLPSQLYKREGVDSKSSVAGVTEMIVDLTFATKKSAKKQAEETTKDVGGDIMQFSMAPIPVAPDAIMVPLMNNRKVYGPFYAAGAQGQVSYEKDDNLNPWAYKGYDLMRIAGQAKAEAAIVLQTFAESGEIEFPGFPTHDIGSILINSGPYITTISCSASDAGYTTKYSMQTWTPIAGRTNIVELQKLQRIIKSQKMQEREIRKQNQTPRAFGKDFYIKRQLNQLGYSKELKSNTSQHFITCDQNNTVIQPYYNAVNQGVTDYENRAIASLNTLFVGTALSPSSSGNLTKCEFPTSGSFGPNSKGYFPYPVNEKPPHAVSHGSEVSEFGIGTQFNPEGSDDYRIVSHKAPMYLTGYGFDVDGQPVPAKNVGGVVDGLTIETAGAGYTPGTYQYTRPDGGEGEDIIVQISINDDGECSNVTITDGGSGYEIDDELTIVDDYLSENSEPLLLKVSSITEVSRFADNYTSDVSKWKSGPIDLRWDDLNKVWGFRTNSAVVVKVTAIGDVADNYYTNNQITPHVVSGHIYTLSDQTELGAEVSLSPTGQDIPIINFRDNLLIEGRYYMANIVGNKYVIDNQAEFRDF